MMKIKVTVAGRTFEVEVGDLKARPVIAWVDGERYEVWLADDRQPTGAHDERLGKEALPPLPKREEARRLAVNGGATDSARRAEGAVLAPIPGVIVSIAVQPGQAVTVGQELCVLEAMKMKNVIRAPRAGVIAAVRVVVGQTVKHKDVLMEY